MKQSICDQIEVIIDDRFELTESDRFRIFKCIKWHFNIDQVLYFTRAFCLIDKEVKISLYKSYKSHPFESSWETSWKVISQKMCLTNNEGSHYYSENFTLFHGKESNKLNLRGLKLLSDFKTWISNFLKRQDFLGKNDFYLFQFFWSWCSCKWKGLDFLWPFKVSSGNNIFSRNKL